MRARTQAVPGTDPTAGRGRVPARADVGQVVPYRVTVPEFWLEM